MSTALVTTDPRAAALQTLLARNDKAISSLLPDHIKPRMLLRTIFTSVTQTPKLLECTPASILRATLQAAMLGLPPNDGRGLAYLVPFNKKDGKNWISECQLITGYRGLVLLARQGGDVAAIDAGVVHAGDTFDYEKGLNPRLVHRKSTAPGYESDGKTLKRPIIAAWCCVQLRDGHRQFEVLEAWEIERIRDGSQGYRAAKSGGWSSPWMDHPGAMAQKTAVRAEMKLLPGSSERLSMAQNFDDAHDRGDSQEWTAEVIEAIPDDGEKPATLAGAARQQAAPQPITDERTGAKSPPCTRKAEDHEDETPCAAGDCYMRPPVKGA